MAPNRRNGRTINLVDSLLTVAYLILAIGSIFWVRPAWPLTPVENMPIPAFSTTIDAGHPLVGKIFDVATGNPITPSELTQALGKPGYLLIGEKHDNPDHRILQSWIYRAVLPVTRPGLAYEMMGEDQQETIDAYLAKSLGNLDGLGAALNWDKTGWPDWSQYQPMAESARREYLPVIAANLPRSLVRKVYGEGPEALGSERASRTGLNVDLPAPVALAMLDDVFEGHCKLMPRENLAGMVHVQRVRDAVMAENLIRASADGASAILIAGNGHVRADHGVPMSLRRLAPAAAIRTIALLEVQVDAPALTDYAKAFDGALPFDYVWFTPRANERDYCAELKARMGGHKEAE